MGSNTAPSSDSGLTGPTRLIQVQRWRCGAAGEERSREPTTAMKPRTASDPSEVSSVSHPEGGDPQLGRTAFLIGLREQLSYWFIFRQTKKKCNMCISSGFISCLTTFLKKIMKLKPSTWDETHQNTAALKHIWWNSRSLKVLDRNQRDYVTECDAIFQILLDSNCCVSILIFIYKQ